MSAEPVKLMADGQAEEKLTLHLLIYGRVQGVYFRGSLQREAENRRVAGWVRNRMDGSVEAVLHGEAGAVNAVVVWAQRGPNQAQVENVVVEPIKIPYSGFEIRPTL